MSDRITGVALLLLALAFGIQAWSFRATFFTDPLGARAFPLAIAALLVPLAAILVVRPRPTATWPARTSWPPLGIALATFVVYALVLEPIGFLLATTGVFVVFARLFHARAWQGLVAGLLFSATLYALFVWALGLYLPVGDLWERWL